MQQQLDSAHEKVQNLMLSLHEFLNLLLFVFPPITCAWSVVEITNCNLGITVRVIYILCPVGSR